MCSPKRIADSLTTDVEILMPSKGDITSSNVFVTLNIVGGGA